MATIRKRGTRYQAIVRRKLHHETRSFERKQDAELWVKQLEVAIERNGAGLPNSAKHLTFGTLCQSYKERALSSKNGLGKTKNNVLNRLDRDLGHHPAQIQKHHLKTFVENRLSKGIKPPTLLIDINYVIAIIEHGANWMELQISSEPAKQLVRNLSKDGHVGRSSERDRRPTNKELEMLRVHFQNNNALTIPMKDIMDFAITTGMRLGEICRIEWKDYDEHGNKIIIQDRKHPTKKESHIVPLIGIKGLDPHQIIRNSHYSETRRGRIFPYNRDSVSTAFRRACRKLGIEDLKFHDLRHEAISSFFEEGLQAQHVMLISGHSNLQQLSRYTNTRASDVLSFMLKSHRETTF